MNPNANTSASTSKIKPILMGVLVVLMLGVILYAVGLSQGRAQLAAQKTDYEARIQTLQKEVGAGKTALEAVKNANRLIESRAAMYRTALDLERRNFGTANTHLQEGAATLARVQNAENVDAAKLSALQKQISSTNINVATDLEAQRRQVLEFAAQIEKLTPVDNSTTIVSQP